MNKKIRIVVVCVTVAIVGFAAMQLIPAAATNPPVRGAPHWDSAGTEVLARRACFDCHSNETRWPAYSRVAPLSWWIVAHVRDGRRHLNFSEPPFRDADEAAEEVRDGGMPLRSYTLAHADARLTQAEARQLAEGLARTFGRE